MCLQVNNKSQINVPIVNDFGGLTCELSEGFSWESLELSTLELNCIGSCSWIVANSPFVPPITWTEKSYSTLSKVVTL